MNESKFTIRIASIDFLVVSIFAFALLFIHSDCLSSQKFNLIEPRVSQIEKI